MTICRELIDYGQTRILGLIGKAKKKPDVALESLDEFLNPVKENLE